MAKHAFRFPLPSALPSRQHMFWRRLTMFGPVLVISALGWWLAWPLAVQNLQADRSMLGMLAYAISCLLFVFTVQGSWAMLLGLGLWLAGRRLVPLEREAMALARAQLVPSATTRTAVLIPAFHENPREVFARVQVMQASLTALQPQGVASDVDIFVLSDSYEPEAIAAEAAAYQMCLAALKPRGPAVYYRRRESNVDYKVGNLKEFCTRWGGAYAHLLVLDADSLMTGEAIRRLIVLLERYPQIGGIQTTFMPYRRESLFCRVMQFSTRLYSMPATTGMEYWVGPNSNYFGHNAIFRTEAFTGAGGLPVLPGRAPLGGRILSHDIVEAAFLARAGWHMYVLPNLPGTYEELPPTMLEYMQRDRRWCAGNLQHQHIICADGVPFINRLLMVMGIMSYAAGPLWLSFLMIMLWKVATHPGQAYGATAAGAAETGSWLLLLTALLLWGPRLMTLLLALVRGSERRAHGGGLRLLASAVLEQVFMMLMQPAVMLFYTRFVLSTLCGKVVRWDAQPRGERGISWREALRRHRSHLLFAATLGGVLVTHAQSLLPWFAPMLLGLLLAPAFTVLTSRTSLGNGARRLGLFLTAEDTTPAREVKELQALLHKPARMPGDVTAEIPALPTEAPCSMPPQSLQQRPPKVSFMLPMLPRVLEEDPVK